MKRRLLSLLLVFVMVLGMLPTTALADGSGNVYASVSYDGQYLPLSDGGYMAHQKVSISELEDIDLSAYGLGDYQYDADGDGAYEITALHLLIYTHEEIMGRDWDAVGVSGSAGSIFFEQGLFGFNDCNLQYYLNGDYPAIDGSGLTADQIVLNDGDFIDVAGYSSCSFYSDTAFGFHYFLDQNGDITHDYSTEAGTALNVHLGRAASYMGAGSSMTNEVGYTVSYGSELGTADGTVTTGEDGKAEITFAEAGTYYLWVDGGYGAENPLDIVSSPAYAKVIVTGSTAPEQPEEPEAPTTYTVTLPTGEGYTATANGESASPVAEGGSYSFTVTIDNGYDGSGMVVKANHTELTADEGVYTISNITADQIITVDRVEVIPTTYTVSLPAEPVGYTITPAEGSVSPVTEGDNFSFTVAVADGYKAGENFAVKANDVVLTDVGGVYTIENITADQTVTVDGVVVEKPATEKLTVTVNVAPSTANVTFYSDEAAVTQLTSEDVTDHGVIDKYHQYVLTVAAGTYSYRGEDGEQDLGGMSFNVDAENTAFTLKRVNYYGNKNATATVGAYTLTLEDAVCGTQYVDNSRGAVTPVLLIARGSSQKYTPAVKLSDAVAENYIIKSISQTSVSKGTSAQNASFSLTALLAHTITAPADAVVKVFNQIKNYVVENVAATGRTENADGTVTTTFKIPAGSNYSYRVSKDDKITYAGYLNSKNADAIVVNYENSPSPTTTEGSASIKESSVLVNVNKQNDMTLAVGETFRLRAFRAWQIVNTVTANIMIEPDYHYTVLSGAEHIELVPVTDKCTGSAGSGINANWIDIRGISEGTAVVEVSYDAIVVGSDVYGATDPARKMLVVIHVGGAETTASVMADGFAEPWDAEFDTVYFTESTGTLTFSATVGEVAAEAVALSTDNGSTWTDLSSEEGKYTTSGLVEGCNLLKLTAGSVTEYQVIRTAKINYTISRDDTPLTEDDKIKTGDELVITFDGLFTPVPKMSGVYNPGYVGWPADQVANGHKVVYTVPEGWTTSNVFSQYNFATNNAYTVTVGTAVDTVLSGGHIKFNNMGDLAGAHRNLTDEGRTVNMSASNAYYAKCVLPDIPIMAAPTTFSVTLPSGTGYTVTAAEGSASPVTEGGSFSFSVAVAEGYDGSSMIVKANDAPLTAIEGVYTISNITADQTITVEGVVEKPQTPALTWQEVMAKAKAYLTAQAEATAPIVNPQKGEWVVIGLTRSGTPVDSSIFDGYSENVVRYVAENIDTETGRLHSSKSTDNSRVILALTALGKDVTNVGGHDLLKGLTDTDYVKAQGVNGPIWALIALDSGNYTIPANANADKQVTRQWLIDFILEKQLTNGGWALSGQISDDMTPMAVQALAPYYEDNAAVKAAVDKALVVMADMIQNGPPAGTAPEIYAQIIVALSTMKIDCETDSTYIAANGDTAIDLMLVHALDDGTFCKNPNSNTTNQMSTEQAFYALVAYDRFRSGKTSLYDMSDILSLHTVELLPCENGTITVSTSRAAAGETITVTVTPALGYKLKSLKLNDTDLTVTDGTATFEMPNGTAVLEAVFEKSQAAAETVSAAMETLTVRDADRDTYQLLEELRAAYSALTAAEKLAIRTSYNAFLDQVEAFEAYLDAVADDAADEIDDFLADLDKDDYSSKQWRELEDLADEGKSAVYEGRYAEEIEDILNDYLDELEKLAEGEIEVTFRLIGDFQHDNGVTDHDEYVTWIPTTEYKLPAGSTVYDVFVEAIDDFDLNERGASRDYVESIQAPDVLGGYWLGEFDNGQNSGWMYTVNGDHPGRGLTNWELEDGDEVIWHYVDDYIKEERTTSSKYYYRWLEADDIDPETYVENMLDDILTVGKHGKADPDEIELRDIGKNITFTFTPDKGYKIKKVTVDGKNMGAIERYTYKDLQIDSRIEVEFVKADAMPFIDVDENDWFYDDVQFVVENGLFEGTAESVFSPESTMTRAMLVTVLYRLEGEPYVSGTSAFTDVQKGQYYSDAVLWATRNGIVGGYGNGLFGTNDNITREQMAAILYRYAQYKGYSTTRQSGLYTYSDREAVSAYALDAMEWANAEGLINGRTASTLVPQGTAIRAEVAAIMHRFVENIVK